MSQLGLPMNDERHDGGGRRLRRGKRRHHGRIAVALALVFVLALVGAGFLGLRALVEGLRPGQAADFSGRGSGSVTVRIEQGDSIRAIGQTLVDSSVVASVDAFVDAANNEPRATDIQPGSYVLRRELPAGSALAVLVDPASRSVERISLPEGRRLAESLDRLAKGTGLPRAQLDAVAAKPDALGLPAWGRGRLEGFVYPASYEFDKDVTPTQVLATTVTRFTAAATSLDLVARAQRIRQQPYAVLTVASLVEAEAPANARAKVARVIYNRLAAGMPLQLDATVNYATGKTVELPSAADRATVSPYNTYRVKGLPPGPINSPGEAALEAALNPASGPWLYYVTVNLDSGETKFARTLAEHERYVAELRKWLAANR